MLTRRKFLGRTAAAGALALAGCAAPGRRPVTGELMTVLGRVDSARMGPSLVHEHVMLDFIGADQVKRDRYRADEVFEAVLPRLTELRDFGCRTLIECTPAYIGRDATLLKRLSQASELHLITNTGFYGAQGNKYLPALARTKTADALARVWLAEWRDGIEDTGVRPGFIKIGVDAGPLSNLHRELVRAAAHTHLASGMVIASHTGDGRAAMEQLEVLREHGVSGTAFIWVHAQNEPDVELYVRAAEHGAWIEFDAVSDATLDAHVELVLAMKERRLLHRVLVSQDAGWYEVGLPGGGEFRPYHLLFTHFLPALRAAGLSERELHLLVELNPRAAFTLRVRED